jgi:hypothetical protein
MTVRYQADYKGTGQLMRSPEMLAVLEQVARRGESIARSLAASHVVTGDYEASFIITTSRRGGDRKDRAEARLLNTSGHAVDVEWRDDLHILARTAGYLEATGG